MSLNFDIISRYRLLMPSWWKFRNKIEPTFRNNYEPVAAIEELKEEEEGLERKRKVHFNSEVIVGVTFSKREYDRSPPFSLPLTFGITKLIKLEVNRLKAEMEIHQDSQGNTHFFI